MSDSEEELHIADDSNHSSKEGQLITDLENEQLSSPSKNPSSPPIEDFQSLVKSPQCSGVPSLLGDTATDPATAADEGPTEESDGENSDTSTGSQSGELCAICLSHIRGDIGSPDTSECDHAFCLLCILEWAKNNASCPQDRRPFERILVRSLKDGEVINTIPVEAQQEKDEVIVAGDITVCEICYSSEHEDRLLLCDGCDLGYHLYCLTPPLLQVPIEEWFCPMCVAVDVPQALREATSATSTASTALWERIRRPRSARQARPRMIPRTRATERVLVRIALTREKKRGRRNKANRSDMLVQAFNAPRPFGQLGDDDIDAAFNTDELADKLLTQHPPTTSNYQKKATAAKLIKRSHSVPSASYCGRSSLDKKVSLLPPASSDLLGDILGNQSVLLSKSKDISINTERKIVRTTSEDIELAEDLSLENLIMAKLLPSKRSSSSDANNSEIQPDRSPSSKTDKGKRKSRSRSSSPNRKKSSGHHENDRKNYEPSSKNKRQYESNEKKTEGKPKEYYHKVDYHSSFKRYSPPSSDKRKRDSADFHKKDSNYHKNESSSDYHRKESSNDHRKKDSSDYNKKDSSGDYNKKDSSGDYNKKDSSGDYNKKDSTGDYNKRDSSGDYNKRDSSSDYNKRDSSSDYNKKDFSSDYHRKDTSSDYSKKKDSSSDYNKKKDSSSDYSKKKDSSSVYNRKESSSDYYRKESSDYYRKESSDNYRKDSSKDYFRKNSSNDNNRKDSSGDYHRKDSSGDYHRKDSSGDYHRKDSSGDYHRKESSSDYHKKDSYDNYDRRDSFSEHHRKDKEKQYYKDDSGSRYNREHHSSDFHSKNYHQDIRSRSRSKDRNQMYSKHISDSRYKEIDFSYSTKRKEYASSSDSRKKTNNIDVFSSSISKENEKLKQDSDQSSMSSNSQSIATVSRQDNKTNGKFMQVSDLNPFDAGTENPREDLNSWAEAAYNFNTKLEEDSINKIPVAPPPETASEEKESEGQLDIKTKIDRLLGGYFSAIKPLKDNGRSFVDLDTSVELNIENNRESSSYPDNKAILNLVENSSEVKHLPNEKASIESSETKSCSTKKPELKAPINEPRLNNSSDAKIALDPRKKNSLSNKMKLLFGDDYSESSAEETPESNNEVAPYFPLFSDGDSSSSGKVEERRAEPEHSHQSSSESFVEPSPHHEQSHSSRNNDKVDGFSKRKYEADHKEMSESSKEYSNPKDKYFKSVDDSNSHDPQNKECENIILKGSPSLNLKTVCSKDNEVIPSHNTHTKKTKRRRSNDRSFLYEDEVESSYEFDGNNSTEYTPDMPILGDCLPESDSELGRTSLFSGDSDEGYESKVNKKAKMNSNNDCELSSYLEGELSYNPNVHSPLSERSPLSIVQSESFDSPGSENELSDVEQMNLTLNESISRMPFNESSSTAADTDKAISPSHLWYAAKETVRMDQNRAEQQLYTGDTSSSPKITEAVQPPKDPPLKRESDWEKDSTTPQTLVEDANAKIRATTRQELEVKIVEESKKWLDPYYQDKSISREVYKQIISKCVAKVLGAEIGLVIEPRKIRKLVDGYVKVYKHRVKKILGFPNAVL